MPAKLNAIINGQCHKKAIIHVFFHAAIALVPLSAVVVMFLYGDWKLMFFVENGEFYIYSVVFFTMALYALVSLGLKKDDWGIVFVVLTILFLILTLVLYGSVIHDKIVAVGPTDSAPGLSTNGISATETPSSNQAGADALTSHTSDGRTKASTTIASIDRRSPEGFGRRLPVEKSLVSSSWILAALSLVTFYLATYWEIYREHVVAKKTDDRDGIDQLKDKLP